MIRSSLSWLKDLVHGDLGNGFRSVFESLSDERENSSEEIVPMLRKVRPWLTRISQIVVAFVKRWYQVRRRRAFRADFDSYRHMLA